MKNRGVGEREQLNGLIHDVGQEIAGEMGLPELPLGDPGFDFVGFVMHHLRDKYGLKGQDLDHVTGDVIRSLVFNLKTGGRGPLYNFPSYAARNPDVTWDWYCRMAVSQKASNEIKKRQGYGKNRTRRHLPILPGRADESTGGGVSEESLGGRTESPSAGMEEEERRRLVDKIIPDLLLKERNGHILVEFYKGFFQEGKTFDEIAEHLNQLALAEGDRWYPPKGWQWRAGTVHRMKNLIAAVVLKYFEKKKLSRDDLTSSRGEVFRRRDI